MPGKSSKPSSSSSAKSTSSSAKPGASKSGTASKQPDKPAGKGVRSAGATAKATARSATKTKPSSKAEVTQSRPVSPHQQRKHADAPEAGAKPAKPVVLVSGPRAGVVPGFTLGGGSFGGGTGGGGLGATSGSGWNPTGSHAAFDARNAPKSGKLRQSDASRNAVRGHSGHR